MSDLLDKLNVLLKASMNNFLSGNSSEGANARPGKIPAERLGKDVDQEIARLRKQVDQALSQEDDMQARVEQLQKQVEDLDQQADSAVQRNDEATARGLIQQLQRQKQLLKIQQADLEQHRQATFEVIQHLNTLEAMVSDARRQEQDKQQGLANDAAPATSEAPAENATNQTDRTPGTLLSDLLRTVRERVEDVAASRKPADSMTTEETPQSLETPPTSIPIAANPSSTTPDSTPSVPKVSSTIKIKIGGSTPGNIPSQSAETPPSPASTTGSSTQSQRVPVDSTDPISSSTPQPTPPAPLDANKPITKPTQAEDDDLAQRRSRLSKPD